MISHQPDYIYTHTHPFNGPFSGTTWVSQYQKDKTNQDFTEARNSKWQWHQLGHMQVCISFQTDNHASTPPLSFFYRPDALPAAQPTAKQAINNKLQGSVAAYLRCGGVVNNQTRMAKCSMRNLRLCCDYHHSGVFRFVYG